jgi:hypothetical protein
VIRLPVTDAKAADAPAVPIKKTFPRQRGGG